MEGLEDARRTGKPRAAGGSGFLEESLESLPEGCGIRPMGNQIPARIGHTPEPLLECCRQEDIRVELCTPAGRGRILQDGAAAEMASRYGVPRPGSASGMCWSCAPDPARGAEPGAQEGEPRCGF